MSTEETNEIINKLIKLQKEIVEKGKIIGIAFPEQIEVQPKQFFNYIRLKKEKYYAESDSSGMFELKAFIGTGTIITLHSRCTGAQMIESVNRTLEERCLNDEC